MVYDLRKSRKMMAFRSRLHVHAKALLLSANLSYMSAVQQDSIVIWRMEELGAAVAYLKYMTDDFPADDEHLSDNDYFYDDDNVDVDNQEVSICHCVCFPTASRGDFCLKNSVSGLLVGSFLTRKSIAMDSDA